MILQLMDKSEMFHIYTSVLHHCHFYFHTAMASRGCINHPDNFCYICGECTIKKYRRPLTKKVIQLYKLYFGCAVGEQDKSWAPHICCLRCTSGHYVWSRNGKPLPFAVPMIWREQHDHLSDCYFCAFPIAGFRDKDRKNISYPSLPSAIRPVPHSNELPVPPPLCLSH